MAAEARTPLAVVIEQDRDSDPADDPTRAYEIVLADLRAATTTPVRLTVNERSDLLPRFVGDRHLLIDSSYRADERLPTLEAARVLLLP